MIHTFWTGFATALVTFIFATFAAVASDTVRCATLGPNGEVMLCAVGHLKLPKVAS
jgi:hypothetical protein